MEKVEKKSAIFFTISRKRHTVHTSKAITIPLYLVSHCTVATFSEIIKESREKVEREREREDGNYFTLTSRFKGKKKR